MKNTFFYSTFFFLIVSAIFCGCQYNENNIHSETTELQTIAGRDTGEGRQLLYRVRIPANWIRHDPPPADPLSDTTKALCEFIILENSDIIRITIHNFPTDQIADRIPPEAQVARWKNQFEVLDKINTTTLAQSFSGYSGLLFMGEGTIKGKDITMLGWSLLLAPEHYRYFLQTTSQTSDINKQMGSDITIKAIGPTTLMLSHKQAIIDFAHTFELIKEIPSHP